MRLAWAIRSPSDGRDEEDYEGKNPDDLVDELVKLALARHEQHVEKIHGTWSRALGLSSRRLSRSNRYAPNDRLLKSIVVAVVDDRMQFDEFLTEAKRRYGLIFGDAEGAHLINEKRVDQAELSENRANLEAIDSNAASINEGALQALEAFVTAPAGDLDAADSLAQFEWEADGVYLAFDKPKEKLLGLSDATLRFFDHECEQENSLGPEDRKLLEDLKSRERRADFTPEDEELFVRHRRLLEQDPKLCARWEKALYGKPIECVDFLDGFARVVNNLHAGLEDFDGDRILRFTVSDVLEAGNRGWSRSVPASAN